MSDKPNLYDSPSFRALATWPNIDVPIHMLCRCEVSTLLPQAVLAFYVEVPDDVGLESLDFYLVIEPEGDRFVVWIKPDNQPWLAETRWTINDLDWAPTLKSWPTDDLSNALYNGDAAKVFDAFTKLRGGAVEFVDWSNEEAH